MRRAALLNNELEKKRLDAMLVTGKLNVTYLSGFLGDDASILVTGKARYLITDSRYLEEARRYVKGFVIKCVKDSTYEVIADIVKSDKPARVGFESMNLPYEVASQLKRLLKDSEFVGVKGVVESLRSIKDEGEIKLIRDSVRVVKEVLKAGVSFVKPGLSEKEVAKRIEVEFIERGVRSAFDIIVASGANSSMPHARPGDSKIAKNSFVMLDLGCERRSYCSDITRMAVVGKPVPRFKKIYDIVRKAHDAAIDSIRPGIPANDVDTNARRHIESEGYGKYFGHSVGHGVGMEVHEGPSISKNSEAVLKPGMVFTVEPAIYIPGFGGVRIEDMVLVTDKGYEILTG